MQVKHGDVRNAYSMSEKQKGKGRLEDRYAYGRIILKWTL
jgi:hypothetical protein